MGGSPDGYSVFPSGRSVESYERKVIKDDEDRYQRFLDAHKDRPEVQAWLASLEEPAA